MIRGGVGCGLIIAALMLALWLAPLSGDKLNAPQAYRYYDHNQQLLAVLISKDDFFRMHVPLENVSELFTQTLLLQEDQHFYQHPGIDPFAILRAAFDNLANGRVVSGASTITMQLARMMERRKRTLVAKIIEAFRALQLEWHFNKDEILAYYLALAPYGGNIEGLQAAAFSYFGKPASFLSPGEIALLVALPKSPNRYRPDRYPAQAEIQRNKILLKMLNGKLIDNDQYNRALAEKIPTSRQKFPNLIPHTAWYLRKQYPNKYVMTTTLDENLQRRTQALLSQHVASLHNQDIYNGAAVIIDNASREVRAIVGSADYFDQKALGANDGSRSLRSPGSTLKPFVYGLAMQSGLIAEKTVLYDIPINYGGYAPQNYSNQFLGPVNAREALTESLNVVAVNLSKEMGIDKLHALLKKGGISSLHKPASYYGLPLALGGVEVSLLELTNLYASLANYGDYLPFKLQKNIENPPIKKLLSAEASWLISHILTDVERPDFPQSWQFSQNRTTVAWKTGTSYGHQDAWSIGYNPQYTIGVWMGNFDAKPAKNLAGSKVAGPLLFDIFQAVTQEGSLPWFHKPEHVKQRMVCTTCGTLPNQYCQQQTREYYIANITGGVNSEVCDIPQLITYDRRTRTQANSSTPIKFIEQGVFNIWPADMAAFLLRHGVPVRKAPIYDPANMAGQKYYPPQILSPVSGTQYIKRLDRLQEEDHGIKLDVAVTNRINQVSWFMDGKLIAQQDPIEPLIINPSPGKYLLSVIDSVGGKDEVRLVVKDYRELADEI